MKHCTNEILNQRALDVAQRTIAAPPAESLIPVVGFVLFPEHYAVEVLYVKEVLKLHDITPLPGTPPFVAGVVNYRGSILSVLNLKTLFGLTGRGLTELNKIVVLRHDDMEFGVLADSITGNHSLQADQLAPPPLHTDFAGLGFLKGTTPDGTILLDAYQMLKSNKLIVNQK